MSGKKKKLYPSEFKDKKVFKIHAQVHLLKGHPSDVDMNQE